MGSRKMSDRATHAVSVARRRTVWWRLRPAQWSWARSEHTLTASEAGVCSDTHVRCCRCSAVQVLNLAENHLEGPLPSEWARDPEATPGDVFPNLRAAALLPGMAAAAAHLQGR